MASLGRKTSRPSAPAALRKITEGLANELGSPSQRVPDWSDFEWSVVACLRRCGMGAGQVLEDLASTGFGR